MSIEAKAAQRVNHKLQVNDLARPKPRITELETTVVSGLRRRTVGSSYNYNQNVKTGKHYEGLGDTAKMLYRGIVAASTKVYGDEDKVYKGDEGVVCIASDLTSELKFTEYDYIDSLEAAKYDHIDNIAISICAPVIIYDKTVNSTTKKTYYSAYLYLTDAGEYGFTNADFAAMKNEMIAARNAFLADSKITSAKGVIGKELAIHDKLIAENEYDEACAHSSNSGHLGHSAYGALVQHKSVCDGYSMALTYLLQGVGIESRVITGFAYTGASDGGHAWNVVYQDGDWYEVDSTWDDADLDDSYTEDDKQQGTHIFYHLTTSQISNYDYDVSYSKGRSDSGNTSRKRDGFSLSMPTANGTKYNYENVAEYVKTGKEPADPDPSDDIDPGSDTDPDQENKETTDPAEQGTTPSPQPTPANPDNQASGQEEQTIPGTSDASFLVTFSVGNNDYEIDESGNATVTAESNKKIKKVTIGSVVKHDGKTYKITEIEKNAYKNCKKLTSISIGKNIEKIGSGAFRGCVNLKKITIRGNNLNSVGSGSFKNINKNAKIIIICKDKKTFNKLVKKIKKAGAKKATFVFKKG